MVSILCVTGLWAAAPVELPSLDLTGGLGEQDAVTLALARNPDLIALRQGRAVAEAQVAQAALLPSPELRIGISDVSSDLDAVGRRTNNVGLRWSPPRLGELGLLRQIAQSKAGEVTNEIAVAEQKLAAEVRLLHRTICLLDAQARIAEESVAIRKQMLEAVTLQVKVGVKSTLDQSMSELALADAEPAALQYRAERRVQPQRLASKLDLPPGYQPALRPDTDIFGVPEQPPDREQLIAKAIEQRSELAAASARCDQADLSVRAARRDRYPWFSRFQVSREFGRLEVPATWGFRMDLELPIFRWRNSAVQPALAELGRCLLQQQAVKAQVLAEVDELLVRLEAARNELQRHRESMETVNGRHLQVARVALASGQSDLLEPLMAQARQLSARQSYLAKLMDVRALEVGLAQALGGPVR